MDGAKQRRNQHEAHPFELGDPRGGGRDGGSPELFIVGQYASKRDTDNLTTELGKDDG
jgi:hypothetical protein